ncbi:MAG: hypothetical protein WAV82_02275, partial [Methylobacter sp.]
ILPNWENNEQSRDFIQIYPDKNISHFVGFATISLSLRCIVLSVLCQSRPTSRYFRRIYSWQVFCSMKIKGITPLFLITLVR